jgi:hypothetical protein
VNPASTLDRALLRVHGFLTAPSIHAPEDGARVATDHPTLVVNNGASPEGIALSYEFRIYSDPALSQERYRGTSIPEGQGRTSWRVPSALGEDATLYWRARAGDGFSVSAWTAVASFTVDQVNLAPSNPLPDTPAPGARVASRSPLLTVRNAHDPEMDALTYEFRLAGDAEMSGVIASAAGVTEGEGLTSWTVPVLLDENGTYYWSARASDGPNLSVWSAPVSFMVDTVNDSPSAPVPRRPAEGAEVATLTPELAVGNASDAEGDPLTYVFQIDRTPSFDSPALQTSPPVPTGPIETAWTPVALADNTTYHWRAAASDGNTQGPWAGARFFVNLADDPPAMPVPLDPVDGRIVETATPTLRLRNATDADGDSLVYDFLVVDAAGSTVASVESVPETPVETSWTVAVALAENGIFRWSARARDAESASEWTAPASFRVNAVAEPPTAPTLVSPANGAVVGSRRPTLVVGNASSPDGLTLAYTFELDAVASDGTLRPVEQVTGVAEGVGQTSWTPSVELADGEYAWRARASDPVQAGPWMDTARFHVAVDVPPSPPTGLAAVPGDARVSLRWNASPEPDVTRYRVYRSLTSGGSYGLVAEVTATELEDVGLANGVTVYYVVTALDARFESAYSAEVAATPTPPPPGVVTAEVGYVPARLAAECLLCRECDDDDHASKEHEDCPGWIRASVELPGGFDPEAIDLATVLLHGSVRPDPGYRRFGDGDGDGVRELEVRFRLRHVAPLLHLGVNTLSLTGRAGAVEFRGGAAIEVTPLSVDLRITPRTLNRQSHGQEVQAILAFADCVDAEDVDVASLRLNETVPIRRVVSSHGERLIVKFDRQAVIAVLPAGDEVEVRVSGLLRDMAFVGRDHIRVIH